ncbi:MAG: hypothetical protein M1828_000444 [Chrysothrix sp. TS-e1954]|nr:MAG: hypothetical protein M1828_000444 [Chrysothrix sp. TS-e1954]
MGPDPPLPLPDGYTDVDQYVNDLLEFITTSDLLENLCGGVHILDFFTRSSPDLYTQVIEAEWRRWFDLHSLENVIYFILHEDVIALSRDPSCKTWRGQELPPKTFIVFIASVRRLLLRRDFQGSDDEKIPRNIAVGMNAKKLHEVSQFARYVDKLTKDVANAGATSITHVVDFGAGQNYLGRTLASERYGRDVVAVEGRSHNIVGARQMDVAAKIAPKEGFLRNKKIFRAEKAGAELPSKVETRSKDGAICSNSKTVDRTRKQVVDAAIHPVEGIGSVVHVQKQLDDGDLMDVVASLESVEKTTGRIDTQCPKSSLAVVSLHSCGNLSHHGLRSITLNPSVRVVAIVGCCYNLMTERFKPSSPNVELPDLRPPRKPRPSEAADGTDPHGFPMSSRILHRPTRRGVGIHLNITARMMAVQAPQNWGPGDSEAFFTRHFFRALLQRIFLDFGVVDMPPAHGKQEMRNRAVGGSTTARDSEDGVQPMIIGGLRKSCYESFVSYVRAARAKLVKVNTQGPFIVQQMGHMSDEEIQLYAERYKSGKKNLSIVWTLMAFVAGLVEALIVIDRWLWLQEQDCVASAWVEGVFEYRQSPRNLVVVGVKGS